MLTIVKKLEAASKRYSEEGLRNTMREALSSNMEEVAQLTRDQLSAGENSDGSELPKYKQPSRYLDKIKVGQPLTAPNGSYNLKNEGTFHSSIIARIEGKVIQMQSSDSKYEFLGRLGADKGLLSWNEKTIAKFKETKIYEDFIRLLYAKA